MAKSNQAKNAQQTAIKNMGWFGKLATTLKNFWEMIRFLVEVALIVIVFRTLIVQPFNIPSGSMIPTILIGDYVFVTKWDYGYTHYSIPWSPPLFKGRIFSSVPERGDIAVFRLPTDTNIDYIKRVVGLPDDTIEMQKGILHINGQAVRREKVIDFKLYPNQNFSPRVPHYRETFANDHQHYILEQEDDIGLKDNTGIFRVPEGHLFMMGDNRDRSQDSRYLREVGYVPIENFIGKAGMIFFSFDNAAYSGNPLNFFDAVRWDRIGTFLN